MNKPIAIIKIITIGSSLLVASCQLPKVIESSSQLVIPDKFQQKEDTNSIVIINWRQYFKDPLLVQLIDTALANNQELNKTLQEIEIARNEVRIRKGAILPTVGVATNIGVEKVGRYTSQGAGDATTDIKPGKAMPDPLGDFGLAAVSNWEVDIWKKLRNAKKAAVNRYLATVEGKHFVQTSLIAEVASSYYELIALDNQLDIVLQNIALQKKALDIVYVQKEAARATELAVKKFEAEVYSSQSKEFEIRQQIVEEENKINFLLGRYPQPIPRTKAAFLQITTDSILVGTPAQLLANRPDIKQAELQLKAAKLDVKVARAEFYPSLGISAVLGLQAFNPAYLAQLPESILANLAGDLVAPLINKNAIKAEYLMANARQKQALLQYEQTLLNAYLEVSNQIANINNLQKNYSLKDKQVEALNRSIAVSADLFKATRVDYFEVLMTQRDALEAALELVDTKKEQLLASVAIYKQLGGGWK